ncbi:ribosomal protein S18-alanine N-acetyltransferase [Thioalkalivibrio sp. XN279]|uniref:ribosomal protein S18-alanine N-acetyltransferase n=1 Tax=Thioalkalivibrio sp. XN279 TaxID=2714953 RepID=UPI001407C746|nr:ribosomal protein S18-alanine N-acetyltransferase [Thioalkalivibrio sp. XN279]NHA14802.1 ribosomal protein S18-alanine N-acetyltransferase [Thioalkalivibrio sp. XN279]
MSAAVEPAVPRMRRMTEADLEAVWDIEQRAYVYPWSRGIFIDCLRVPYECDVVEQDGRVLGYTIVSMAADEAHLLNLCLDPQAQGQGLGRFMLEHVLETAQAQKARVIYLEVRPSNKRAIELYLRNGFRRIGVRPRYYRSGDGREDALVLARTP